jgi:hypothetical protein
VDVKEFYETLLPPSSNDPRLMCCTSPPHFRLSLFPYQRRAVHWMITRERGDEQPNGGLLADDMGLGKVSAPCAVSRAGIPGITFSSSFFLLFCLPPPICLQTNYFSDNRSHEPYFLEQEGQRN